MIAVAVVCRGPAAQNHRTIRSDLSAASADRAMAAAAAENPGFRVLGVEPGRSRNCCRCLSCVIYLGRPAVASTPRCEVGTQQVEYAPEVSKLSHSSRMSLDGSTASARQAGMADATIPSSAIVNTAPPTTTGSRGFA